MLRSLNPRPSIATVDGKRRREDREEKQLWVALVARRKVGLEERVQEALGAREREARAERVEEAPEGQEQEARVDRQQGASVDRGEVAMRYATTVKTTTTTGSWIVSIPIVRASDFRVFPRPLPPGRARYSSTVVRFSPVMSLGLFRVSAER
jgi:hypothetical protein